MTTALILNILFAFVVSGFLAFLYLLPSFIALKRRNRHIGPLMLLNVLLGWTALVWIATLIWAIAAKKMPETDYVAPASLA